MRRNPLAQVRTARMRALAEGTPSPVAFFWDDPELLTVDGDTFEIHFNDMIDDWFGISAAMIVEALIAADGRDVLVHLNSPGGMVTEGLAIHSTFKQYAGNVTMRVEGIAASAASFVMLAADQVLIEPNAMVMIHDAWDLTIGPASEHRKTADLLDKVSDNIASMYAGKSGIDQAEWRTAMLEETWYVGQEAVEAGLADALTKDNGTAPADDTTTAARWSGIFANVPRPFVDLDAGDTLNGRRPAAASGLLPTNLTQPFIDLADAHAVPVTVRATVKAADIPPTPVEPPAAAPAAPFNAAALHTALKGLVR